MAVDHTFAIKKFKALKELYVVYSAVTSMPFVTCDEESYNDQVWVFTEKEKIEEFAKAYIEKKVPLRGLMMKNENLPDFYLNLHAMGVNEIVFQDGAVTHKLELNSIMKSPDFSKLPDNKRPVLNPELLLSAAYFLQTAIRPGMQVDKNVVQELEEEMQVNLVRATYLLPLNVIKDANGKEQIGAICVKNKNGENFQPIFTDQFALARFMHNQKKPDRVIKMKFSMLEKSLVKETQGYIVNPGGINLILKREQLSLIAKKYM